MFLCHAWKYTKTIAFVGGVLTATVGAKALKSERVRKATVNVMAKGMKLQQDAMSTLETMKEEAQDLCHEAREEAAGQETAEA